MTYKTAFAIGDRVWITELEKTAAVVRQISISQNGTTYLVHWLHDGKREDGWLFEHELEKRE